MALVGFACSAQRVSIIEFLDGGSPVGNWSLHDVGPLGYVENFQEARLIGVVVAFACICMRAGMTSADM
jgi:hypothetical protein